MTIKFHIQRIYKIHCSTLTFLADVLLRRVHKVLNILARIEPVSNESKFLFRIKLTNVLYFFECK